MAGIDHAVRWGVGDHTASEAVRRARNVEQNFRNHAHGSSASQTSELLRKFVGLRNVGGHLLASADEELPEGPEPRPLPAHVNVGVERLHAKQDYGLPRPSEGLEDAEGRDGMAQGRNPEIL